MAAKEPSVEPGQRAYEAHTNALGLSVGGYFEFSRLHPDHQRAWAAAERASAERAWDEGYEAFDRVACGCPDARIENPYRLQKGDDDAR